MPSKWAIDLHGGDSRALTPDRLHAVASSLFSFDVDHHAPRKSFTIRPVQSSSGKVRLTVGIVDDTSIDGFLDAVSAHGDQWRFGPEYFSLSGPATLLDFQSWDDLANAAEPAREIEFHFLSPTFFRRGNAVHLLPSASVAFGHLRRRWFDVFGNAPACELDDKLIHVTRADLHTRDVVIRRRPRVGITGRVTYDLANLSEHERAAMEAFARLAPFAGIGSSTAFGCGAADWSSRI